MEDEISRVGKSFDEADSLEKLKTVVETRIDQISASLKVKRNEFVSRIEEAAREQERLKSNFENIIGSVQEKNKVLEEQSRIDPLTGILNRRVFEVGIDAELDRFHRYNTSFSLIFFDIDYFKMINDTYGHHAGDKVLSAITQRVGEMLRKPDLFARYGGEEFVIILPETSIKQGLTVASKLREEVASTIFEYEDKRVPVTISVGITEARTTDRQFQTIVDRADNYMYTAKERGRNQVVSDLDIKPSNR